MHLNDTGCCAVQEICQLEDAHSPEQNMRDMAERISSYYGYDEKVQAGDISGFYIFTAVVKSTGYYHMGQKPTYGEEFSTYITKNGLGTVTVGPARPNRKNHSDHTVKVFVWAPNARRLAAKFNHLLKEGRE